MRSSSRLKLWARGVRSSCRRVIWRPLPRRRCRRVCRNVCWDLDFAPQGEHRRRAGMNRPQHVPVLLEEAMEYLKVPPGGVIVDATLGLAGHSAEIAKRLSGTGTLIYFDPNPQPMAATHVRLRDQTAALAWSGA